VTMWILLVCAGCRFDTSGVEAAPHTADAAQGGDDDRLEDAGESDGSSLGPAPVHLYSFRDGTAADAAGGAHGKPKGGLIIEEGRALFLGGDDGGWIELPAEEIAITRYEEISFEAWFTYFEEVTWQRVFDFGGLSDANASFGARNVFFTPTSGGGDARAVISNGDPGFSSETVVRARSNFEANRRYHLVVTLDADEISLYQDGVLIGSTSHGRGANSTSIDQLDDSLALLGRSTYSSDGLLKGELEEFSIFDVALTADEVASRFETRARRPR
jgi:hypothetical protein